MWHATFKGSGKRVSVLIACVCVLFLHEGGLQMSNCDQNAVE